MITYKVQPTFIVTYVCYGILTYILNNKKYSEEEKERRFTFMVEKEIAKLKELGLHKWLKKHRTSHRELCIHFTRLESTIIPIQELLVEGVY